MRRFLVPPELAPSVALSREVKELESDLERRRLAAVAAEEEANKAGLAASLGLTWPLPKRGRGPPSGSDSTRRPSAARLTRVCCQRRSSPKSSPCGGNRGILWWRQRKSMVLESCGAAEDGIEELDQPEDVEGAGPVKKRKLHRAPSGWSSSWSTRCQGGRGPNVSEDTVRRFGEEKS